MAGQQALQSEIIHPIRMVNGLERFDALFDHDTDAMICTRRLPASVRAALQSLPARAVSGGRFRVPAEEAGRCIHDIFSDWAFDAGEATRWLAADVTALARQMARILAVSHLVVRVELVRDDACRKFHRDTLKARLICTYSGPGTELGIAGEGDEPEEIVTVPTGCPVVLKGKLWPRRAQRSVLHRSPPLSGTGASRLLVVLNEA